MTEQASPCSSESSKVWLCAALTLVTFLGLPSLLYPFGRDQAMFAYIGNQWLHGALPYRSAWDIKPPGVFAAYAAALHTFGQGMVAIRVMDLLATLAATAGLFAAVHRWGSARGGFLSATLFGVAYFTGFDYWHSAQAESLAAPIVALYIYALLRGQEAGSLRWWSLAGASLGLLVLFKTTFVAFALLAAVALWPVRAHKAYNRGRWALTAAFITSAVLPIALVVAYFALHGAARELVELLVAQKGYAREQHQRLWSRAIPETLTFVTHPALLLSCLAAGAALLVPNCRRARQFPILISWLGVSAALVAVQGRFYWYHWLPVLPPLAVLGGWAMAEACRLAAQQSPRAHRMMLTLLMLLVLIPVAQNARSFGVALAVTTGDLRRQAYWQEFTGEYGYSFWECVQVAEYVRARTEPGDPLLVYAFEPAIYFLANRASCTRHLSIAPIFGERQIPMALRRHWLAEQMRDVAARPPRFLIGVESFQKLGIAQETGTGVSRRLQFAGLDFQPVVGCGKFTVYRLLNDPATRAMASIASSDPRLRIRADSEAGGVN